MNRQIKFRVWDKKNKTFAAKNGGYFLSANGILEYQRMSLGGFNDVYSYCSHNTPLYDDNYVIQWFTNLKDSKGKEIYEGDILKYNPSYQESGGGQLGADMGTVDFEYGCFYFDDMPLSEYIDEKISSIQLAEDIEIIGNIFENSELLK